MKEGGEKIERAVTLVML